MTSQADKLVRTLCAVSALMLLLAVDKTCPWLAVSPEPTAVNPRDDGPGPDDDPKSPPAIVLRAVPPDAIAPRTSGAAFDVAAHSVASDAHHTVATAPPDPSLERARWSPTTVTEAPVAAWQRISPASRAADTVVALILTSVRPALPPAIHTSIRTLAPPGA